MAIDSDIRDQAYQFFIQEAPELLQVIETELLTLGRERSTAKIHSMMRAAHSIKGGAASVGLEAIKTLAHRLEDYFKALHHEALEIDSDLETLLLQAYDCLRLPLMQQIQTDKYDAEQALVVAEPVFAQIESKLEWFLGEEAHLPSSIELGVDIALSIFEVDVVQGLERLTQVLERAQPAEVAAELRAQAEVFIGIAELLSLPGLGAISHTTIQALDANPAQTLEIAQLALADFQAAQEGVLQGDRTQGGSPSAALTALATSASNVALGTEWLPGIELIDQDISSPTPLPVNLDAIFGMMNLDEQPTTEFQEFEKAESEDAPFSLDAMFGDTDELGEQPISEFLDLEEDESESASLSLDAMFGDTNELAEQPINEFLDLEEDESESASLSLDAMFGDTNELAEQPINEFLELEEAESEDTSLSLDAMFGDSDELTEQPVSDFLELEKAESTSASSSLDAMFGDSDGLAEQPVSGFLQLEEAEPTDASSNLDLMFRDTDELAEHESEDTSSSLDAMFGDTDELAEQPISEFLELEEVESEDTSSSLDAMFGDTELTEQPITEAIAEELTPSPFNAELDDVIPALQPLALIEFAVEAAPETLVVPSTQSLPLSSDETAPVKGARLQELVESVEQIFSSLPLVEAPPTVSEPSVQATPVEPIKETESTQALPADYQKYYKQQEANAPSETAQLSVRVALDRLERMNNMVGELAINRNGLSLQNEQLQETVQELLRRFDKFQAMANQLRDLSDHMLIAPERYSSKAAPAIAKQSRTGNLGPERLPFRPADFDSLEMDSYGELHLLLQSTLEEVVQIEETVGDVVLLTGQSNQTLEQQRQMLTFLRDDLMWARMLPLGEVLNRFPRTLRDLSTTYKKPVDLKLTGAGVLVDKAVLEKLYDPLLHLLRNAFDHGIESPEVRRQRGKLERGRIEIRAYHQGSQTVIEVRDDGQGINLERIRKRAIDLRLLTPEATVPTARLLEFLFEPGFSTALQVSELSGRGVGLDVVRSQLRSLKGTVSVSSEPERGTIFTLRIPLTLTISKLLVCLVGSSAFALPSDGVEEILIPQPAQVKQSGKQRFLHWRNTIVPIYPLSGLIDYACPLPEVTPSPALVAVPSPEEWAAPLLLLKQDQQVLALEVDRLVTEQELVIKPLGAAIAPPSYIYGCTILGDGSVIPVIDGMTLLHQLLFQGMTLVSDSAPDAPDVAQPSLESADTAKAPIKIAKASTLLIIDDSVALRQTLALTLQKTGYRVLQARDGREAIEQLQQNASVQLIVCDVEMPNMNGFEFLSHRRQDTTLSQIPVVMLTSRGSDKHRRLATHLGANAYFTKPYLEHELLPALKQILDQQKLAAVPASSSR